MIESGGALFEDMVEDDDPLAPFKIARAVVEYGPAGDDLDWKVLSDVDRLDRVEIVRALLDAGATPNFRDDNNMTPLDVARLTDNTAAAMLLSRARG